MSNDKFHIRLPVKDGESVHAMVMRAAGSSCRSAVFVFSHGFTVDGTESARHFVTLAEELRARGYSSILFDYRGSGYSDRAFENMTLDTEIQDLGKVLDYAGDEFAGYEVGVWGESLGCAVTAHTIASRSDVAVAVLWSLSAELYERYRRRLAAEIERVGYTYTPNGFKVGRSFLESLRDRDTFRAIRDMRIPTLLVHGTADDVASIELSRRAHAVAPETTELHEIEGGNHGFEAQPLQFGDAFQTSLAWIDRNVRLHN